jgi:hypothetical protein
MPCRRTTRAALAGLAAAVLVPTGSGASAHSASCPPATGTIAYVRAGALHLLDLGRCTDRVLARHVGEDVSWSADGRWLATDGALVSKDGKVVRPAAVGVWAPRGHDRASVTPRGGLVLTTPGGRPRRLLPDGWGASGAMFAADGALAVSRDLRSGGGPRSVGKPKREEIWLLRAPAYRARLVYRLAPGRDTPPDLAAVSPDASEIAFWTLVDHANSANLDGRPLELLPTTGGQPRGITAATLVTSRFVTWCGHSLVAVSGADRITTFGKSIVVASPPRWRVGTVAAAGSLSWVSPACSPDRRRLAVAAGPGRRELRFGLEARSIWLVPLAGGGRPTRLTPAPPPGLTDEEPQWTPDGRFVLFVRSGPTDRNADARGRLYAVEAGGGHRVYGPLADLGVGGNDYGTYGWAVSAKA